MKKRILAFFLCMALSACWTPGAAAVMSETALSAGVTAETDAADAAEEVVNSGINTTETDNTEIENGGQDESGQVVNQITSQTPPELMAYDPDDPVAVEPGENEALVFVDGELIDSPLNGQLIKSKTYVPIRAVSNALGANSVVWDNGVVTVTAPGFEIVATLTEPYIIANGRYIYNPEYCCIVDGNFMIPARVLGTAFDAQVTWDSSIPSAGFTKGSGAIEPADEFYNQDDLYWLAHIINAEANNQPLEGQIAVGNVVLNRVKSPLCPNTVYDVIFDFSNGIQFVPAYTGSVYATPSDSSWIAAKLALEGVSLVGDSLFFASVRNCWASYNRPYYCTIGAHDFYL